jgi:hypothetical protein
MEISYETIIKYLSNEEENENIVKPNLINKFDNFPDNIKNLLKNDFYIYGILNKDLKNNNISLWSSILFLIDKQFILLSNKEQINYINNIKNEMIEYLKNNYKKFKNKRKFSKNFALELLKNNDKENNPLLLELISYCFKINILIIDFDSAKISSISLNEYFNPWVPTIFLSKNENIWQPLLTNKKKLFSLDNLKFIFDHDIEYYCNDYLEQNFSLVDNIFEILELDPSNKQTIEENENIQKNETFIKKINLNKNKLKKMRKNDIINLIKEFNMEIDTKQNKDILINEILIT